MVKKADENKNDLFADTSVDEPLKKTHPVRWGMFAFLAVFCIGVLFTNAFLQRKLLINQIKKQVTYSIEGLNQFGWDLAYDNVSFHAFPLLPLGEFNHLKLYNRYAHRSWNVEKVRFNNSILNPQKIVFEVSGKQFITFDNYVHKIDMQSQEIALEISDSGRIELFSAQILNLAVADWAEAEKIVLLGKDLPSSADEDLAPSFQVVTEISNIKLNGLLNYPLSQDIRKIYLNASLLGKIDFAENFRSSLREWLAQDGHVEINEFNISWAPLLLVGKGNLYLNENFKPILRLNTTSKALAVLIDDLEKKQWLDSKGVFVAKILLASKSYKSDENDAYLTVTTPISVRDDALLIEKIAVKKFNQPK